MRKLSILFLLVSGLIKGQKIENYVSVLGNGECRKNGNQIIVLRKFSQNNKTYYFTVFPATLKTEIVLSDSIKFKQESWQFIRKRFSTTPYIDALHQVENYGSGIQDAGFTHFLPSQKGFNLTIDLCPSRRPLDRDVFTELINEVGKVETPVPLAISITGRWMNEHPDDLNWLKELDKSKKLDIVWVNHSYNHYTEKNVPLKMNFLLAPGTNLNAEVLNTEIALLEKGIVPSIFFRFPGLVSDPDIYDRILNLGLIPVGSDAWLAKGQWPKEGSIVLIHANGNEPIGVHDFLELLKKDQNEILGKRWELFDLRKSIIDADEIKK